MEKSDGSRKITKCQKTNILPLRWIGNICGEISSSSLVKVWDLYEDDNLGYRYKFHSKVFKYLKKQGTHLQYSVFIVAADSHQINLIMKGLEDIINDKHDDVRAYKIPAKNWHVTIGASMLPDGTLLGSGSTLSS